MHEQLDAKPNTRSVSAAQRVGRYFEHHWQRNTWLSCVLFPVTCLHRVVLLVRSMCYRIGVFPCSRLTVPVIVVGNISVGGTGKTPLVLWCVQTLITAGFKPGVVLRGYKGTADTWPLRVHAQSNVNETGDEAKLLAQREVCPVAIGPKRAAAAQLLIEQDGCNVIICDDGLQHYQLHRDLEIAVVDVTTKLGNGRLLPAGPLREPASRLRRVDALAFNLGSSSVVPGDLDQWCTKNQLTSPRSNMTPIPAEFVNVCNPLHRIAVADWHLGKVNAVAAIGHPERFFKTLQELNLTHNAFSYPDHHKFTRTDLDFVESLPLVMTEKDAVKCQQFAAPDWWYLRLRVVVDGSLNEAVVQTALNDQS